MHVGICCVWLNESLFLFSSHDPLNACWYYCVFCVGGWMAGRLWGSRSKVVPAEGLTVGWGDRGGGGTVGGWSDKHNFRLKHARVSSATRLIVFYLDKAEQKWLPLALMLWQLDQPYPKLWLMLPQLKSCKVKQASPVPTSGCAVPLHLHPTCFSFTSVPVHSQCGRKTCTICCICLILLIFKLL